MVFKINVGNKGKTLRAESSNEDLVGMFIGDKLKGDLISEDLKGYDLEITGTSDKAGFPGLVNMEGPNLRKVLLTYGRGMKRRPKGGSKKLSSITPKGLRIRKSVRGKEISSDTVQINTKVLKEGAKKFDELIAAQPKKEKK